ncbi:MAG: hypothetical protein AAGA44_12110 [Pseudomonadota bacterium]
MNHTNQTETLQRLVARAIATFDSLDGLPEFIDENVEWRSDCTKELWAHNLAVLQRTLQDWRADAIRYTDYVNGRTPVHRSGTES